MPDDRKGQGGADAEEDEESPFPIRVVSSAIGFLHGGEEGLRVRVGEM